MKKKAEAIYASVMDDAPEWLTSEELAAAKKPQADKLQRPATGAPDTDTAKLLARIDKTLSPRLSRKPPPGLREQGHGRAQTRTTRPGRPTLKEKRASIPTCPTRGLFRQILTHVAAGAKKTQRGEMNRSIVIILLLVIGCRPWTSI